MSGYERSPHVVRNSPEEIRNAIKRAISILKGSDSPLNRTTIIDQAGRYVAKGNKQAIGRSFDQLTIEELAAMGYEVKPKAYEAAPIRHAIGGNWAYGSGRLNARRRRRS